MRSTFEIKPNAGFFETPEDPRSTSTSHAVEMSSSFSFDPDESYHSPYKTELRYLRIIKEREERERVTLFTDIFTNLSDYSKGSHESLELS